MLLREAHNEDIDQLMAIEEMCYDHPWPREAFSEEIEQDEVGAGIVAEEDGIIVGYLTGLAVVDEFHLHNIAVHPDYRGQGIGRSLIEALEALCERKEYKRVILEVRKDNESARRLYLSRGFEAVGIRKDYYGPGQDAHLYTKQIGSD